MKLLSLFSLAALISICASSCSPKIVRSFVTSEQIIHPPKETETTNKKENSEKKYLYKDYIPDIQNINHTPIRWIRINIHFLSNQKGDNNFSEEEGREFAHRIVKTANERLLKNEKMNLPLNNDTPVLPAQYQYVLSGIEDNQQDEGIYFHKNDHLYVFNKKQQRVLFSDDLFETVGVRPREVVNIFFMEHHPDSIQSSTYKASGDGTAKSGWVKIAGAYMVQKANNDLPVVEIADNFARIFNKLMGQSLGLYPPWKWRDGCDDTPKNANCWTVNKKDKSCDDITKVSNNMMDDNEWRTAITPCQIGRVHERLSHERKAYRKTLIPTWCQYNSESTIYIKSGDSIVWKGIKDLEGDIIIENDAILTIQSIVSLPENAKILVKIGGILRLKEATITNRCGQKWKGIEVEKEGKTMGIVELLSPSIVENAIHELNLNNLK